MSSPAVRSQVRAVVRVHGLRPELGEAVAEAVRAQSPGMIVLVEDPAGGVGADATAAEWTWVLDGLTVPRPGALDALLEAPARWGDRPAPLVLASKILDTDGALHPDALPNHEVFEKELSVAACGLRMTHVRAVRPGSMLVAARAVARFGGPRPGEDEFAWTARMLRSGNDPGLLVPASVAVRRVGRGRQERRRRLRMLAGGAWSPTEKLWEAFQLGGDVVTGVKGRARGGPVRRASPAAPR